MDIASASISLKVLPEPPKEAASRVSTVIVRLRELPYGSS